MASYVPPHKRELFEELSKQCKLESLSPTHFFAVPLIHDSSVSQLFKAIETSLVAHDSRLHGACVPACTAHITLGVLHLSSVAARRAATDAILSLKNMKDHNIQSAPNGLLADLNHRDQNESNLLQSFHLSFNGLNTFGRGKVLYMQPVSDLGTLQLHDLAAAVRNVMQAAGISMTQSNRSFSPHCTVAKINNVAGQACSIRQIPQVSYAEHINATAGPVAIREVQLCAMADRPSGSYYRVLASLPLDDGACVPRSIESKNE